MREIFIHIGLHKTATTFLQNEVFPKFKEVKYYNLLKAHNRQALLLAATEENGKILISDEDLSGSPLTFGSKVEERERMAYALKKLIPDAKIIVGIRDKKSWYNSVKKHILRVKPYRGEEEIEDSFDCCYLDFEGYINLLRQLFGKKNIYVYKFENLKQSPDKFVEGICNFIGVKKPDFENKTINKRIPEWQLKIINKIAIAVRKCYKMYLKKVTRM